MSWSDWSDELVGKSINAVWLSDCGTTLRFDAQDCSIAITAEGDCCSESWFYHSTGAPSLVGYVVAAAGYGEVAYDAVDKEPLRQEDRKYYELRVTTRNGVATFEMRNDSNGYYGGYLSSHILTEDAIANGKWRLLLEDF